jgi:methylenetetrahydrofolate reductase (NADPH)
VHDIFKPLDGKKEETYKAGVDFAVEQCNDLLKRGAPGLHFYALNKIDPTKEVLNKINR